MAKIDSELQKLIDIGVQAKAKLVIDDYNAKIIGLEKREKAIKDGEEALRKKEEEAQKEEERIQTAVNDARRKAEEEIRASEAEIRADERQTILANAEEKAKEIVEDARSTVQQILDEAEEKEKFLNEADVKAKKIIDDANEKAEGIVSEAKANMKAEREKLAADQKEVADALDTARNEREKAIEERTQQQTRFLENLEKYNKSVEQRFAEQFAALNNMRDQLAKKRVALEDDQFDIEEDRKYIKELKEKYSGCSTAEVDRLKSELRIVSGDLEKKNELLELRDSEIVSLREKLGGTGGKSLAEEVARLTQERDEVLNAFADMPGADRITELENIEREYDAQKRELAELKELNGKLERELSRVHISQIELDSKRAEAKALDALNAQLQEKLKFISETYKANRESKFAGLLEIDRANATAGRRGTVEPGSLPEIVSYVRAWGATRKENPLYYSEEIIRVFVASLAASFDASRLMILQGLSGTGKTSLPRLFAESLGLTCDLVSVQPSWRDNRELLGYDNDFTNRFKETEFTKFVYAASKDQKKITLIVLDEMNLARIEYYFADFLSELERRLDEETDVWTVPLISNYTEEIENERPDYLSYDSGSARLKIGKNVWFIGTANNDDSTSTITDKVYDRAQILDLDKREQKFAMDKPTMNMALTLPTLERLFRAASEVKENRLTQEDWDKIHRLDNENLRKMDITFGSRIKTQLDAFVPVFVACGGTKEKAIDYYLAHKILRKLDEKFDAYIREELGDLQKKLDTLFGKKVFTESALKIHDLRRRNFGQNEDGE